MFDQLTELCKDAGMTHVYAVAVKTAQRHVEESPDPVNTMDLITTEESALAATLSNDKLAEKSAIIYARCLNRLGEAIGHDDPVNHMQTFKRKKKANKPVASQQPADITQYWHSPDTVAQEDDSDV